MTWNLLPAPECNRRLISLCAVATFLIAVILFSTNTHDQFDSFRGLAGDDDGPSLATEEERMGGPRVAVCLVGGARRFELTGPALLDRVVNVFNQSHLFLNVPLDKNAFKLSLLRGARRIAAVKIYKQEDLPLTNELREILSAAGSPKGLQGLIHYFQLVEGCVDLIDSYQAKNRIQYDWIVRTRLDSYWSEPLSSDFFLPATYVLPLGSDFLGINDRLGIGDLNTSRFSLKRFSVLHELHKAGYRNLGAEPSFETQLKFKKVRYQKFQFPFCILSERPFPYPPERYGAPVVSIGSRTPLSGAYCRPCSPVCKGECASKIFGNFDRHFSWIDGNPDLCDGHGPWDADWERHYDAAAGEKYAAARKRFGSLDMKGCVSYLRSMKRRAGSWDAPSPKNLCLMGLGKN